MFGSDKTAGSGESDVQACFCNSFIDNGKRLVFDAAQSPKERSPPPPLHKPLTTFVSGFFHWIYEIYLSQIGCPKPHFNALVRKMVRFLVR